MESKISAIHWKRPLSLCPYLTANAEAASLSYKKCCVISQPYIYTASSRTAAHSARNTAGTPATSIFSSRIFPHGKTVSYI